MKRLSAIALFFVLLIFSQCGLENVACKQTPLFTKGFDMPNLITILNTSGNYSFLDTLWFKIEVPSSFYANQRSCTYSNSELRIHPSIYCYYSNKPENALQQNSIVARKGFHVDGSSVVTLIKENELFVGEYGLILNDTSLKSVGVDTLGYSNSSYYWIKIQDDDDTGCQYDDDACVEGKKRNPYNRGFIINTAFQGGQCLFNLSVH